MKKLTIILGSTFLVVMLGLLIFVFLKEDKAGPVIQFTDRDITYTEGEDTQLLLQEVTAYDTKDGDVTDTILIESIIPLRDNKTAKVIYAAKDRDNHIVKDSIIVNYVPNKVMEPEATIAETMDAEATATVTSEALPVLSAQVTVIPQPPNSPQTNTPSASPTPTALSEEQPLAQDAEEPPGKPTITLTTPVLTLKRGSQFDPMDYIAQVTDDVDNMNTLFQNVKVEGVYNKSKKGTYILEFYVIDTDQNKSDSTYLKMNITD